ncbi:MAG: lysylphosphatidylglycerol synthase transmembrane domain-containing protein [Actinomycetota bacterium]|nr:lysylphosphatidylglycerol synthase transmembrane domain-containing protein [Actinomycetota bacterium]
MTDPTEQTAAQSTGDLTSKLDKKKSIILGVIGLAVVVIIFWKVIPQIGSYEDAAVALEDMTTLAKVLVGVTVVLYLAVYGFPFMAATPGLRYWRSQQVNQAAFAISNGVPAGGAFGLAVQYAMLASYRIPGTVATSAITAVGLWSIFVSLGLPILGIAALSASGGDMQYAWVAPVGLAILVTIIVVFVLVMRSPSLAIKVGNLGNRLAKPLRPRIKALKDVDLVSPITKFRTDMYGLLKSRWAHITVAQLAVIMTQFLILYVALRGVQGWDKPGTSVIAAFGAFATSQIMLMVPITPGGLGTVDALMIALLQSVGVSQGDATAADLVWRAASYIPQIIIGIIALITWFKKAGETFAAAKPAEGPASTA